jgi:hypothetical protein
MLRIPLALGIVLAALAGCADGPAVADDGPAAHIAALAFRTPLDLGTKAGVLDGAVPAGALGTSCQDSLDDGDCGLGEPSVEVDGAGTIYVSGVCCLTVAPPVYVSRDGGETFSALLTSPPLREQFGIEGDFAIDAVGLVYFSDIEFAATFQVSVWEADGTFLHHTKWPAPPIVDRDWIRAEGDGTVYYVYNTGSATNVYKSMDAAQTFTPIPMHTSAFGLGNAAIWPGRELCIVGGSGAGGNRLTDCTTDGGASWSVAETSAPAGGDFPVPVFDEAGTLYVASSAGDEISIAHRDVDGTWHESVVVSPPGHHRMPWAAAGAAGALAIAWYGTPAAQIGPESEWFLHVAVSGDAAAPDAQWKWVQADVQPVFVGALGRDLLDFLQVDIGPDGAVHVAYSDADPAVWPDGNEERLRYVRSEPDARLAMQAYWWGP